MGDQTRGYTPLGDRDTSRRRPRFIVVTTRTGRTVHLMQIGAFIHGTTLCGAIGFDRAEPATTTDPVCLRCTARETALVARAS